MLCLCLSIGCVVHDDRCLVGGHQASAEVDHIPDHGVLLARTASHGAAEDHACGDAHRGAEAHAVQLVADGFCGAAGPGGVIRMAEGGDTHAIDESDPLVVHKELTDEALSGKDDLLTGNEDGIHFCRVHLLGALKGKAAQVDKGNGHLAHLGHELGQARVEAVLNAEPVRERERERDQRDQRDQRERERERERQERPEIRERDQGERDQRERVQTHE